MRVCGVVDAGAEHDVVGRSNADEGSTCSGGGNDIVEKCDDHVTRCEGQRANKTKRVGRGPAVALSGFTHGAAAPKRTAHVQRQP